MAPTGSAALQANIRSDAPTVHAFGIALADTARHLHPEPEILIGMDTRESGPWIAEQVAGGLAERGVRARLAGVITTPGVAYLTRADDFVAGVMISASHNPYQDNGIKVFGHSGFKLPDAEEHEIEGGDFRAARSRARANHARNIWRSIRDLDQRYIDYLLSTVTVRFDGIRMVIDCGNGAASNLAPELFRRTGAEVHGDLLLAEWAQHQPGLRRSARGKAEPGGGRAESGSRRGF